MDRQDLKVHIEEIIPRPAHVVFDAIAKREKLIEHFAYGAFFSAPSASLRLVF